MRTRVAFAVPVVDSVPGEVYASHLALTTEVSREFQVVFPVALNVFPHARAREQAVGAALEHGCKYLLFLDSDMEPPPGTFSELLRVMNQTNAAMTVAHYYRRGYPFTCTWSKGVGSNLYQVTAGPDADPVELTSCGLACNLIDLSYVRQMTKPYFKQGNLGSQYVWEDGYFCQRLRDLGGKIIGVPKVRVRHLTYRQFVDDLSAEKLQKEFLETENGK